LAIFPVQATFARGELSPRLHGRVDIEHYQMGLAVARNWIVMRQGGIMRRPGTYYISAVKDQADETRLIRFEFSETQAYAIEMGDLYFRFHTNGGRVESAGTPVEVVTPYTSAQIWDVQYTQSADTLYLTHPSHAPRKLVRNSETSWTLSTLTLDDGPYLDEDTEGTTFTPAGRGSVSQKMTDNTNPSGVAADSDSTTDAFKAFDLSNTTSVEITGTNGWVSYEPASAMAADAYTLCATSSSSTVTRTPTTWQFQGYDGADWVTLDSREGETGWSPGERRYYEFVNETAYDSYRLIWTAVDGANNSSVGELLIHEVAEDQTAFNLTASAETGINGGSGFLAADVGRSIRLRGSDGKWRWARIITRTSTTVVTVQLYGHALPNTNPITRWQLSSFSSTSGYPACCGFFEERFALANTASQPRNVWLSKSESYENFGISEPLVANDGINSEMTGGRLNPVMFLEELEVMVVGTAGEMRTITQRDTNDPFSAVNAKQKKSNTYGAAAVQPIIIGDSLLYTDRYRRTIYEFGIGNSGRYGSVERSIFSDHLAKLGVKEMTFQQDPDRLAWFVMEDGRLVTCTYVPEQDVYGFTQHRIGGVFGSGTWGVVESAVSISSADGDVVYMVVKRTINGATKRYVEYLTPVYDDGSDIEDAVYLDSALTYEGAASDTISGLSHLEGRTVGAILNGVDIGDFTVSSGAITIGEDLQPEATTWTLTVGLRYESRGETLRAAQAGQRDGTAFGRKVNLSACIVDVLNTGGLKIGTLERQRLIAGDRSTSENPDSALDLLTGTYPIFGQYDKWKNGGVMVMTTDRAYPAVVRAVVLQLDGEP
jgi:hypothetical protein